MAGVARRLLRSFAGGEITPEMFGRIDLDKMQTGLAMTENFRILPHGPAQNRAGFQYVLEVKDSTKRVRLIPFAYNSEQTMVLEVGDGYCRFHTQGATLLEATQAITAVTQASPGVLTYVGADPANGQVMYLAGIGGMTELNGRFVVVAAVNAGANTFELTDLAGDPIDTTGYDAYTAGGTMARVYEIVTPWAEADLFDLHYTQSADVLTVVEPGYAPSELRRLAATNWQVAAIAFAPTIATPAAPAVATGGSGGGTPTNQFYRATAVSTGTFEESLASPSSVAASIDLSVAGNYVDVTPAAVADALRYNIYKQGRGGLFGYIGQSDGTAFRDDNITPDMSQTPSEVLEPFTGAGDYPGAVTYIEQRRVFAGTDNRQATLWATRPATESNLSQSVPLRDDDALVLTVKAMQQNRIRHLMPLNDLLAFTTGGEFRIFAANSDALTPSSATPKAQSYIGASNVHPALAENAVLYAQAVGGHIREFAYSGDGLNGALFANNDISVLAPHLFDGYTVVDMAFSRTSTCPILWVVRNDGVLLGMTYVPGQNVRAWHRHTTDGLFESVCCVAEDGEDVLYVVVQRTVDGRQVRYIERLHSRQFTDQADAFHVDSGLTYSGAPTTSITGGHHLNGKAVVALADGAVIEGLTFVDGVLTPELPQAASTVHVGLPYVAELQTLPLSYQGDEAFGQGSMKNVNEVHLRVSRSGAMHVGPTGGRLVEAKRRTTESYGTPPALRTGWDHLNVAPKWDDDAGVTVQHRTPTPLTVLAMVLDVTAGG